MDKLHPLAHGYRWQVDKRGNHRLLDKDGAAGPWAADEWLAVSHNGEYVIASKHWADRLPCEVLLTVVPAKD